MNATVPSPTDFDRPIARPAVLTLIDTGLKVKEYRFARQMALAWLATFPGDLGINLKHAQALLGEGKYSQVAPIVEDLCQKDPEFLPAQRIRAMTEVTKDPALRSQALAAIHVMTGQTKDGVRNPDWAAHAWESRQALQAKELQKSEELIHQALTADPASPLLGILHLQIARQKENPSTVRNLAQVYSSRYPECLQFKLYLADALIEAGDEPAAVALLHQCAANDAAGQVTGRVWGANHAYKPLWPSRLEIVFEIPVPAGVSAAMGWNQLVGGPPPAPPAPAPAKNSPKPAPKTDPMSPEAMHSIQKEFDRLAKRFHLPYLSKVDARYPILVAFSARHGLESVYGPQTAGVIIDEMNNLVDVVKKRAGWGAMTFIADDPLSVSPYGIKPAPSNDAWKLKLTLHDLDAALAKKGAMIGALLIVGGNEVVPFHRLPNPTDDADPEVLSDNPYSSLDENYFIPDWPSGRLPGGSGSDSGLLLSTLRRMVDYHKKQAGTSSSLSQGGWLFSLLALWRRLFPAGKILPKSVKPSFGYSAAIWKQSSLAAYKPIGEPPTFTTCPPTQAGDLLDNKLIPSRLSYFNLHGLPDGPDWYGQRDPMFQPIGVDYPTALTTRDILNSSQATQFVFSEACYGGYIENKTEDQSIALKFISCGCQAMAASTCVAYGSVSTPLIAADLLGYYFWSQLQNGKTAGEALQQAKISLVNEMNKRQGYLDGEDQKTLISFVLYGDPLATIIDTGSKTKSIVRPHEHPVVRVISDYREEDQPVEPFPVDMLSHMKGIVDQYLPGMKGSDFALPRQRAMFNDEGHPLPGSQMGAKVKSSALPSRTVVKVSKQVEFAQHLHHHYARVTLDSKGKIMKLAVSR